MSTETVCADVYRQIASKRIFQPHRLPRKPHQLTADLSDHKQLSGTQRAVYVLSRTALPLPLEANTDDFLVWQGLDQACAIITSAQNTYDNKNQLLSYAVSYDHKVRPKRVPVGGPLYGGPCGYRSWKPLAQSLVVRYCWCSIYVPTSCVSTVRYEHCTTKTYFFLFWDAIFDGGSMFVESGRHQPRAPAPPPRPVRTSPRTAASPSWPFTTGKRMLWIAMAVVRIRFRAWASSASTSTCRWMYGSQLSSSAGLGLCGCWEE